MYFGLEIAHCCSDYARFFEFNRDGCSQYNCSQCEYNGVNLLSKCNELEVHKYIIQLSISFLVLISMHKLIFFVRASDVKF